MQNNEKPIVLSAVLLVISLVVALLLAFTNSITKDKIAENTEKEQTLAKEEVLSGAAMFESTGYSDDLVKEVFLARGSSDELIGWCVNVKPNGYGGAIDLMVGITSDYKLSGIKVVSNSETAGLGAKCTDEEFSSQFKGKALPLSVIKNGEPQDDEIVAITGATITSKAITEGVTAAFDAAVKLGGGKSE